MMERNCHRKTSKNTAGYSKEELVELAVGILGLSKKRAKEIPRDELCKLIEAEDGKQQKETNANPKPRVCGPRVSKKNPGAYSRSELIALAIDAGSTRSTANRMTISELCDYLNLPLQPQKESQQKKDKKESKPKRKRGGFSDDEANKGKRTTRKSNTNNKEPEPEVGSPGSDLEFDYTKCETYTREELRKFAKALNIANYIELSKPRLCRALVKAELTRLWENCLGMDEKEVKKYAKTVGINQEGNKEDVCRQIFTEELKRAERGSPVYEEFLQDYLNSSSKMTSELMEKYTDKLPPEYLEKFRQLSRIQRSQYIKQYYEGDAKDAFGLLFEFQGRDEDCISNSAVALNKHQKAVVNHIINNRGLLVVHSVGSGKSLTAVTAIQCVLENDPNIKVLILTPKSLQENMKKEFAKYGASPDNKRITFTTFNEFSINFKKQSCNNTFLVIDEAHNLKSDKSKRAKQVIQCAKKAKKVLLLTATPVINRPNEITNLISMITGELEVTSSSFDKYILTDNNELKNYLKCKISYFRSRGTDDYPTSTSHNVFIPMNLEYYRKYLQVQRSEEGNFITSLYGSSKNLQVFYNGIRRAANNIESENSPKVLWTVDKIRDELLANPRSKFLVYSNFLEAGIKLISRALKKTGISSAQIDGSLSKEKRAQIVQDYNNEKTPVLFISKAGAEGLDLKGTRHVIVVEPPWSEGNLTQIIGRAVRYKSHEILPLEERHVDIWNLFMTKPDHRDPQDNMESIDVIMATLIKEKQEMIWKFMDKLRQFSIERQDCS